MSLAELKEQASALSPRERFELAAFLAQLEEQSDAEFRESVSRRMEAMDAGRKVKMEKLESDHARRLREKSGG